MTYKKGKDIKVNGDCLVYCYTRRIEKIYDPIFVNSFNKIPRKPIGFEKW